MYPIIDAVIVTFNPNLPELGRCVSSILQLDKIEHVFIVDNASKNNEEIVCFKEKPSVSVISLKKNLGIAAALNVGAELAKKRAATWILTSDQDSEFPADFIGENLFERVPLNTAIIGCRIFDRAAGVQLTPNLSGELPKIDNCITSGSLTNIQAWKYVEGFDEKLFIDQVDFDFCYRVKQSGFKVLLNNAAVLSHEIGDLKIHRLATFKIYVFNHSSFRKYYIVRNIVYLSLKRFGRVRLKSIMSIIKQYLLVIGFERNKFEKIYKMTRGLTDGFKIKR